MVYDVTWPKANIHDETLIDVGGEEDQYTRCKGYCGQKIEMIVFMVNERTKQYENDAQ